MPIIDLQRRLAEVGRIRLGKQVESRSGKKRPAALGTFRLTSADRARIEEAAKLYGGKVTKWQAPSGIDQWEVETDSDKLPVVVPPSAMAFSQFYELWSAGGCQRRCDGVTDEISQGPCLCDPDSRQCEPHTRLSVMLRDLSGLGVWRVDTTGYYAALELQGAVDVIGLAAGRGQMLPATLRLDQRAIKREGEPEKRFVVPVLDLDVSPAQLMMGTVGMAAPALPEAARPAPLTRVPDSPVKPPSIAEQVASAQNIPSRRRAAPIPETGIAPRTAEQAGTATDAIRKASKARPRTKPQPKPQDVPEDRSDEARELAAQDAIEQTQEEPRMVTDAQLTKLGVLLTNLGFDRSEEGRAGRLDFCTRAIKELLPNSPYSGRQITTSKSLTFQEAHELINFLEQDEVRNRTDEPDNGNETEPAGMEDADTNSAEPGQMNLPT